VPGFALEIDGYRVDRHGKQVPALHASAERLRAAEEMVNHVASRAQITRLAQRIEDLADRSPSRPRKFVHITQKKHLGETEEEVVTKYFAQHPEDVGYDTMILSVIVRCQADRISPGLRLGSRPWPAQPPSSWSS
jgi:hypothetical protein